MGRPASLVCLVLFVTSLVALVHSQELSCKDESNGNVDWFVAHKLPRMDPAPKSTAPAGVRTGNTYRYFLSTTKSNEWGVSKGGIDSPSSVVGFTLRQATGANVVIMGYNDQPPIGSAGGNHAHAKGTILVNSNTGNAVWLTHSVPQFPDIKGLKAGNYAYGASQKRNGQSFLCLTLNKNQLDAVGKHLYYMRAYAYDAEPAILAPQLQQHAPWLFRLAQRDFSQPMGESSFNIVTRGGFSVRLFSKTPAAGGTDLWSQKVSPGLRASLYVQSWLCGGGTRLSRGTSGNFFTQNVGKIYIPWNIVKSGKVQNWYSGPTKDHSKFAVSARESGGNHVCIGDMNRKSTQLSRGGGAACFSNQKIWTEYYRLLTGYQATRPQPLTEAEMKCDA